MSINSEHNVIKAHIHGYDVVAIGKSLDELLHSSWPTQDELPEMNTSEVYYKLIRSGRDNLLCVATLQDFDELDYNHERFVRNSEGLEYLFFDENVARYYLNKWFKQKQISPEDHWIMVYDDKDTTENSDSDSYGDNSNEDRFLSK